MLVRLTRETKNGTITSYTYDANGNLINAWSAGNALAGAWDGFVNFCATQIDNIARIAADGKQAVENAIDKIAQDFNNNTTNPPDPSNLPDPDDKWDIHNLKPGDTWVNGQVYNDVINKAHHIFENPTHDHRLDDLLKSFNGDVLKAYESMTKTAQDYINKIGLTNENFYGIDYNFNINGYNMTLRLTNIDGYVRVVTAFIKK